MVARAVDGLLAAGVDTVVVVCPPGGESVMADALDGWPAVVVAGADDRVGSVDAALALVPAEADVVLVHDAARCLCPPSVVRAVVSAVRAGHGAVVPAMPVADTLKRTGEGGRVVATVDRAGLVSVQTPQGFAPATLRAAHDQARRLRAAGEPSPPPTTPGSSRTSARRSSRFPATRVPSR